MENVAPNGLHAPAAKPVAPHVLARAQTVPLGRSRVFEFFSDAGNLERITPPYLRFRILTPAPIEMRPGTLIDYTLHVYGMPIRWQTRIAEYEPERRFVDTQVRGPYAVWHHLHEFIEIPGGTEIRDTVRFRLPLDPLGRLALPVVRRTLDDIFDYRMQQIQRLLAD